MKQVILDAGLKAMYSVNTTAKAKASTTTTDQQHC